MVRKIGRKLYCGMKCVLVGLFLLFLDDVKSGGVCFFGLGIFWQWIEGVVKLLGTESMCVCLRMCVCVCVSKNFLVDLVVAVLFQNITLSLFCLVVNLVTTFFAPDYAGSSYGKARQPSRFIQATLAWQMRENDWSFPIS